MINYNFLIETTAERTLYSNAVFTSGDVRGYRMYFSFKENGKTLKTDGLSLVIKAKRADGCVITDAGVSEGDICYYDVKSSVYATEGELSFEVALVGENGMYVTTKEIIANVREGFGEGSIKAEDKTPVLSAILSESSKAKEAAERAEVSAAESKNTSETAQDTAKKAKEYVYNYSANAAKGKKSGEIIRIDDVSPTMQWAKVFLDAPSSDVGIKRYGKNLMNPALLLKTAAEISDGVIEFESASNLCVALTSTNETDAPDMVEFQSMVFKPGVRYAFSFNAYASALAPEQESIGIYFLYDDGTKDKVFIKTDGETQQFASYELISAEGKTVVGLEAEKGNMYDVPLFIKDIQLEVGDRATEYEPYVNFATHKRDTEDEFYTTKVYTEMRITDDENGYSARNDISFVTIPFEETGKYKLRFTKTGGAFAYVSEVFANCLADETQNIRFQVEEYSDAYCANSGKNTLPMDGDGTNPENTLFRQGDWVEYEIFIPIAGEYEIGIKMGSAVNSTQTVRISVDETCLGANMLYPCTTIFTDTSGVAMTCVYNRDTSKVLGDIETALDSIIAIQNNLIGGETA